MNPAHAKLISFMTIELGKAGIWRPAEGLNPELAGEIEYVPDAHSVGKRQPGRLTVTLRAR